MPRPGHENFVREKKEDVAPIKVGKTHDLTDKDVIRQMPAHYLRALEDNPNLAACCRDTKNNYTYETFKTDKDQHQANMAVFTCTVCNRKHYRGAVSPGKI